MKNIFKFLFSRNKVNKTEQNIIPIGWYVYKTIFDSSKMTWIVVMFDTNPYLEIVGIPNYVVSSECKSFEEALRECNDKIETKMSKMLYSHTTSVIHNKFLIPNK